MKKVFGFLTAGAVARPGSRLGRRDGGGHGRRDPAHSCLRAGDRLHGGAEGPLLHPQRKREGLYLPHGLRKPRVEKAVDHVHETLVVSEPLRRLATGRVGAIQPDPGRAVGPFRDSVSRRGRSGHFCVAVACVAITVSCGQGDGDKSEFGSPPDSLRIGDLPTVEARASSVRRDSLRVIRTLGGSDSFGRIAGIFDPGGSYLLVIDALMDPHIAVLDRDDATVVSRFGRQGEGPGEFRRPGDFFRSSRDVREPWVLDFSRAQISRLQVGDAGEGQVVEEVRLRVGGQIEFPAWVGDTLVATTLTNDATLVFLSRHGEALSSVWVEEPFDEAAMPLAVGRYMLNRATMGVHPKGDRIALGYYSSTAFVIFDRHGRPERTFHGPKSIEPRFHLRDNRFFWDDGSQFAYSQIVATDQYVIGHFCPCEMRFPVNGVMPPRIIDSELHVFTWEGELVAEYYLPSGLIGPMAMGADGATIYGSLDDPYPHVVEFELPLQDLSSR